MLNFNDYPHISFLLQNTLREYVHHQRPVLGDFLTSLLSNDLRSTCYHADSMNLAHLPQWVSFIYNEIPAECWGSPQIVTNWLYFTQTGGSIDSFAEVIAEVVVEKAKREALSTEADELQWENEKDRLVEWCNKNPYIHYPDPDEEIPAEWAEWVRAAKTPKQLQVVKDLIQDQIWHDCYDNEGEIMAAQFTKCLKDLGIECDKQHEEQLMYEFQYCFDVDYSGYIESIIKGK